MTFQRTRLNDRVDRLYARCQQRGGCKPSGTYIVRPFPMAHMWLPVCRSCGVPLRGRHSPRLRLSGSGWRGMEWVA